MITWLKSLFGLSRSDPQIVGQGKYEQGSHSYSLAGYNYVQQRYQTKNDRVVNDLIKASRTFEEKYSKKYEYPCGALLHSPLPPSRQAQHLYKRFSRSCTLVLPDTIERYRIIENRNNGKPQLSFARNIAPLPNILRDPSISKEGNPGFKTHLEESENE